jgi:hypothetical protein
LSLNMICLGYQDNKRVHDVSSNVALIFDLTIKDVNFDVRSIEFRKCGGVSFAIANHR